MNKLTALSVILLTTVFGISTHATTTAPKTTTQASATTTEPATPKLTAIPVSPQVQKLMALHPRLIARIQPHGRVCFDGGDCDVTISVLTAAVDGQPRDGQTIYKAICQTCHAAGLVGAPKFGDKGAWAPRIAKGKEALYHSAINGFNAMPAKGGADIPDEEVKNAVDYMVGQSS